MSRRVLLLTPSGGKGGGIERYVETLEWAFAAEGVECQRVDLGRAGLRGHARVHGVARTLLTNETGVRIVLAHRALLPVATLLARDHSVEGISVICHGTDAWGARSRSRQLVERALMRRARVRAIGVSSFTAGTMLSSCQAAVLPPGISRGWFDMLAEARSRAGSQPQRRSHIVTAFRLDDWRGKGLPQLEAAVRQLGRRDVRLTIAGSGRPSADLEHLVAANEQVELRPGLSDAELAQVLADASLFVLATRTTTGRPASGEGFGLVLLEAQLAGTPVIGPAYGGSRDAYVDQVTGVSPTDESAAALAAVLERLLADPARLAAMGKRAAEWASERYAPDLYSPLVVERLL